MEEKEILRKLINQKLERKGKIIVDASISDENFLSNLLDLCTLNQLRDILQKQGD